MRLGIIKQIANIMISANVPMSNNDIAATLGCDRVAVASIVLYMHKHPLYETKRETVDGVLKTSCTRIKTRKRTCRADEKLLAFIKENSNATVSTSDLRDGWYVVSGYRTTLERIRRYVEMAGVECFLSHSRSPKIEGDFKRTATKKADLWKVALGMRTE